MFAIIWPLVLSVWLVMMWRHGDRDVLDSIRYFFCELDILDIA